MATACNEAPGQIFIRVSQLGFFYQPLAKRSSMTALSRKHAIAVHTTQRFHVLLPGLTTDSVAHERLTRDTELGTQKGRDGLRDQFARGKSASGIAQRT